MVHAKKSNCPGSLCWSQEPERESTRCHCNSFPLLVGLCRGVIFPSTIRITLARMIMGDQTDSLGLEGDLIPRKSSGRDASLIF